MKRDLQKYLHYYLGCEVFTPNGNAKLVGIWHEDEKCFVKYDHTATIPEEQLIQNIKPILRSLQDITLKDYEDYMMEYQGAPKYTEDDLRAEYWSFKIHLAHKNYYQQKIEHFLKCGRVTEALRFLVERGYDCFCLIEAGVAVAAKKEKDPNY